jgi:hypothetical protein
VRYLESSLRSEIKNNARMMQEVDQIDGFTQRLGEILESHRHKTKGESEELSLEPKLDLLDFNIKDDCLYKNEEKTISVQEIKPLELLSKEIKQILKEDPKTENNEDNNTNESEQIQNDKDATKHEVVERTHSAHEFSYGFQFDSVNISHQVFSFLFIYIIYFYVYFDFS